MPRPSTRSRASHGSLPYAALYQTHLSFERNVEEDALSASASSRTKRRHWLRTLCFSNAALLASLWLVQTFLGEQTNLSALLLYVPQQPFLLPTLILLAWTAWKRRARLSALNAGVLVLGCWLLLGWRTSMPFASSTKPTVRVVTWNTAFWSRGTDAGVDQLLALKPDIICLQESVPRKMDNPQDALYKLYAKHPWLERFQGWHIVQAREVTALSRFPLLDSQILPVGGGNGRDLISARWKTPQGPLTTLVVHISTASKQLPAQRKSFRNPSRWLELLHSTQLTSEVRAAQFPSIERAASAARGPVILAGDFNNPPRGRLNRQYKAKWSDAWTQAGTGSGWTFPARLPLMRIDYLWLGAGVKAERCFSPSTKASDHLPVVADVSF